MQQHATAAHSITVVTRGADGQRRGLDYRYSDTQLKTALTERELGGARFDLEAIDRKDMPFIKGSFSSREREQRKAHGIWRC